MGIGPQLAPTPPKTFNFKRNLPFRSGAVGIEVTATKDPAVMSAILHDSPFPGSADVELGSISVNAQGGQDVKFAVPQGSVAFRGGLSANLALGMYTSPDHLLSAVNIDANVNEGLSLPAGPGKFFMLFDWGFDVSGGASGQAALGDPSIKFSADADLQHNYAVIRRFDAGTGAANAISDIVDNFVVPKNLHDDTDLSPFTWIYTLTDGNIKGQIGASYGYDFNWVREAKFAGLTGDIGLKVQSSICATVGFQLSGRWAIIVGRDAANRVVRVRIFKKPVKGWEFALNAGVSVTPSTGTLLPESMDDFIASILGVYGPQALKDLGSLKDWANGSATLSGALAGISTDYMLKFFGHLFTSIKGPGAVFNVDRDFAALRDHVLGFLNSWGGLDTKVASLLWKLIPGRDASGNLAPQAQAILATVEQAVTKIAHGNRDDLKSLLDGGFSKYLSDPIPGLTAFFNSPVGHVLESLAPDGLLAAATSEPAFTEMQKLAKSVLPFVQAGASEQSLLQALHDWIDPRLDIDQIVAAVKNGTDNINDGWLRAKVSSFLEQKVFGIEELKKIDALIKNLRNRAQDYYASARKALNQTYGVSLAATYSSTTTTTAMLDAEFDFGAPGVDMGKLQVLMTSAIEGDFTELLMKDFRGVTLHKAALSHGIERHTHLELHLPFYASTIDHINTSLAAVNCVDAEGQRLVIYQLDSSDTVARITNRGGNESHLALAATIPASAGNATRTYGDPAFTYSYSYRQASRRMGTAQMQYQFRPYFDQYIGSDQQFDRWLTEMDRAVPHATPGEFGYALVTLDLALPGTVVAGWLQAPDTEKSPLYMNLSIALQSALRKLIPFYYFSGATGSNVMGDPGAKKYKDLASASPLLAYSALPLSTSVSADNGTLRINTCQSPYWDWMDEDLRRTMLFSSLTAGKLRAMLPDVYKRLQASGLNDTAKFYAPGDASVRRILSDAGNDDRLLKSLLWTEAEIIDGAVHAGIQLAKFRKTEGADIKQAIRNLAGFGATISDAFNQRVTSVYGGDALRPLGTLLFVAAAQAVSGTSAFPNAMFRFLVMEPGATFDPQTFLKGGDPDTGVLLKQSIIRMQ